MSKVGEAKKKQDYNDKPDRRRCRVCLYLKSKKTKNYWGFIDEELRCKIGGFAVKANAICSKFEFK